ncbi:MAG: Rne/Rng family ribonuclease, partial [Microvirga sp.]
MANKMLIDASHPEETRVVVVRGQKVEEFDFESANRKQLRGNIYLAKVTRVEPSLQAAFVEYGGNRHGFLAFSEIHPDYYQIPVADRQALLEAEAEAQREEEHEEERRSRGGRRRRSSQRRTENDETVVSTEAEAGTEDGVEAAREADASDSPENVGEERETSTSDAMEAFATVMAGDAAPGENAGEAAIEAVEASAHVETAQGDEAAEAAEARSPEGDTEADEDEDEDEDDHDVEEHEIVEQLGGDDAIEDLPQRRRTPRKQYKIQEVIKRRQVMLVQVVKEERGNKGAALTTYLSLAGRYSVLMPNTGRGGGISRKITNAADRKRLKEIAQELEVPEGMGIILRTAGASRTKPEIKRDYEYLMRLWESVRELTLKSAAPSLVYEEGSLIKRAIRDLYNKDIDDVLVSGDEGYSEAKDFMRMLMPSHSKLVQPYRDPQPLFAKFGVESQLDAMFSNVVTLKSGGYLVINPTEALVSIDVNSGRSTREHNIEDTALRTNLEAAEEIAQELEVPEGMGIILRTAGASRTKPEIKRDYEYLMRLWESVRELTLSSSAPALVYEEGSLIKRAIRDLYNKDIDDVMVAGEDGYREAKDFMRMLMPSHSKLVQPYRDPQPLFAKFGVEAQLDAMFSNVVTLKSGGYLVINPTEALVSIDVNSGRSTREHNIEDTALRTNLEASEEIARQLRLRDLAGLIDIDFIDMEEKRNNRAVEKKLNECLKNDRARIQVGRISPFGLLEMSRQRIRTGVLESSSIPCPHCAGTGFVRSTPSVALQVLRSIEETLIKNSGYNLVVRTRTEAAFYILNQKRIHLRELETRFGVAISIVADDSLHGTTTYAIERGEPALKLEHKSAATGIQIDAIIPVDEPDEDIEVEAEAEEETAEEAQGGEERGEEAEGEGGGRRRRRRRRRRGRDRDAFAGEAQGEEGEESGETEGESDEEEAEVAASGTV